MATLHQDSYLETYLKEVELSVHNREERSKNRIHFLKSCDGIVAHGVDSMKGLKDYTDMEELIGKKIFRNQATSLYLILKKNN